MKAELLRISLTKTKMMKKEVNMLSVGQMSTFSKTISDYDVYSFAGITGDFNSVHVNEVAAKQSVFKGRIAHGMLVGSYISAILGTLLPGDGTIYLEQDLKFLKPAYIGDTITAKVVVDEVINPEKGIYRLVTTVTNQKEELIINGFAIVMYNER